MYSLNLEIENFLALSPKSLLRRQLLKERRSIPATVLERHNALLRANLEAFPLFLEAKTVLAYFSFRLEPELSPLFILPKSWGFPRCRGTSLLWHLWQPGEPLEPNLYGIPEPLETAPIITPDRVDLLLVPAVAIDNNGYRLGYGGGYFDRFLASDGAKIPTLGIVFDRFYLPELPREPHDLPLNAICTESRYRLFNA